MNGFFERDLDTTDIYGYGAEVRWIRLAADTIPDKMQAIINKDREIHENGCTNNSDQIAKREFQNGNENESDNGMAG